MEIIIDILPLIGAVVLFAILRYRFVVNKCKSEPPISDTQIYEDNLQLAETHRKSNSLE